jgi:hypothetical protein
MGFFGSNKITAVSSSVYNLAGDQKTRANFLKTTVVGAVLGDEEMGESITAAYLGGPGIKLRNFTNWANGSSGYNDYMKQVSGSIKNGDSIDNAVLATQLPYNAGETVNLQSSEIGQFDASYWAEDWILKNRLELLNTDWNADYTGGQVVITLADGSTTSFVPDNFDQYGRYLYAVYTTSTGRVEGTVVAGTPVSLGSSEAWPDVTGWTPDANTVSTTYPELKTTVSTTVSYSDGRADESSSSESTEAGTLVETHGVWEKSKYDGVQQTAAGTVATSTRSIMYQDETGAVVDGEPTVETTTETIKDDAGHDVTKTTTRTTVVQSVVQTRTYRVDTQPIVNGVTSALKIFIYHYQTGNATLDAMFSEPSDLGEFLPFIPFRLDNREIGDAFLPDAYKLCKKAFKKSIAGDYDKITDQILDNESIGDLDYVYTVFGVSLNVQEVSCKKYLFQFLQMLMDATNADPAAYAAWQAQYDAAAASQKAYDDWLNSQPYSGGGDTGSTLDYSQAPVVLPYPQMPATSVTIATPDNPIMNINFKISWAAMAGDSGPGIKDPAHDKGDLWWVINGTDTYDQVIYNGSGGAQQTSNVDHVTLYWQVDDNNWKSIAVWGLKHTNTIYNGKSVEISAKDALNDADESGFIIPIHSNLYKEMSLVDATQMSTACAYLVFNCYVVKKKPWYATGLFTVIVIIIIIIISIVTWGTGTAPSVGLLGSAAAVGASVGLTGLAAVIVGSIINALAAMILMKLIGLAANLILGPKIGAIVGAIVAVVAIAVGSAYMGGSTMAEAFGSLSSASNIMQLTSAVGKGVAGYLEQSVAEIQGKTQDMLADYNAKEKAVEDQWFDTFGTSEGIIDPLGFTDTSQHGEYVYETADSFLSRTLMTGSDVAQMSMDLLTNFCELTLNTDLSGDNFT